MFLLKLSFGKNRFSHRLTQQCPVAPYVAANLRNIDLRNKVPNCVLNVNNSFPDAQNALLSTINPIFVLFNHTIISPIIWIRGRSWFGLETICVSMTMRYYCVPLSAVIKSFLFIALIPDILKRPNMELKKRAVCVRLS